MYDEMIDQEVALADITKHDKVLVIGCGSVPATSILLAKKTDAQIIAVDYDESAIIKAKDIINWFDVVKNITLVVAEGMDYPLDDFSVVIISYGVKEPVTIIHHLRDNAPKNCRIIYRTAVDIQEGSSKGFIDLEVFFTVKDSILSSSFSSVISYLLTSK
jgi:precorrin-6B methylase 2